MNANANAKVVASALEARKELFLDKFNACEPREAKH